MAPHPASTAPRNHRAEWDTATPNTLDQKESPAEGHDSTSQGASWRPDREVTVNGGFQRGWAGSTFQKASHECKKRRGGWTEDQRGRRHLKASEGASRPSSSLSENS